MNTHTDRHDAARGGLNPDRLAAIPAQMQRFIDDGDRSGIVTLVWRRGAIARLDVDAQRQVLTLKLAAPVATSSMPKPFTVARDGFSLNAARRVRDTKTRADRAAVSLRHATRIGAGTAEYQRGRAGGISAEDPYWDGTTHFVFDPIEFLSRLAALVPRPRGNLVRYPPG